MDKLALSIKETASVLGLAPSTIRTMVEAGQLPAVRAGVGKGKWLIAKQAIMDFLAGKAA